MKYEMNDEQVCILANAILAIAHGTSSGPTGIEGLTMSIGGEGNPGSRSVVDGLESIADSIRELADAIRESRQPPK